MAKLQAFNATKIPQVNVPIDAASSPTKFNNTWTPWEGDTNPAMCGHPPPPPVPACVDNAGEPKQCAGQVDGLVLNHNNSCSLAGWASATGYVGPSMEVTLVYDGTPTGKPIIGSIHRTIAGDHGFILHFPCELAAGTHRHSFVAVAKVNVSSVANFTVGEKCAMEGDAVAC